MRGVLFICTRHEAFGFFDCFALSATLLCLVRSIFLEKDDFFHELFQAGACPHLKDSSVYELFSIYMYKTYCSVPSTFFRYLRLPNALQGT